MQNTVYQNVFSVQFSRLVMSDSLWSHELKHARLPCASPTPGACSNSCPSSWWCYPSIHPLLYASPPAFNLPQHQGLFQWVSSSHQAAKLLELQLQHHSFQWIFQDLFLLGFTGLILQSKGLSRVFSWEKFKSINSLAISFLCSLTLTSINDYWKNHSFD